MRASVCVIALLCLQLSVAQNLQGELRLIELNETTRVWMSEREIFKLIQTNHKVGPGVGFMDVTDFQGEREDGYVAFPAEGAVPLENVLPPKPQQQELMSTLLPMLSADRLRDFLDHFSNDFYSRYYTSETGSASMKWLKEYMENIAKDAGRESELTVTLFEHSSFPQPSVIAHFEGTDLKDEIIVVSAHADSINLFTAGGRSPGADDDGSGVSNFIEVLYVLMNSDFKPRRSIEFIGYAAEEVGLRGAQDIAQAYSSEKKKVAAVFHNEMSGYPGNSPTISVLQDYTTPELTKFTELLIDEYSKLKVKKESCGYGCSDHAAWYKKGFAAVCTIEAGPYTGINPKMHTDTDDLSMIDFEYSLEFTKVALGFAVESSLYSGSL